MSRGWSAWAAFHLNGHQTWETVYRRPRMRTLYRVLGVCQVRFGVAVGCGGRGKSVGHYTFGKSHAKSPAPTTTQMLMA